MKVYLVFQRFREQHEDISSYGFDDEKGADLLKIFDDRQKADLYLLELFEDYNAEHDEHSREENKSFWEDDYNTFIKIEEVY
jgi:hypothetical protein